MGAGREGGGGGRRLEGSADLIFKTVVGLLLLFLYDIFVAKIRSHMWDKLPPEMIHELRQSLAGLMADGEVFGHASLYTGTGSDGLVIKVGICQPCDTRFGFPFKTKHMYSCDNGAFQESFIMKSHPEMQHFFGTVAEVANDTAYCKKMKKTVIIPQTKLLTWGFICKSKSKASSKSHEFKSCVQKGIGVTGESFQEGFNVVRKHKPDLMILENLQELMQETHWHDAAKTIDRSDAAYMMELLENEQYWAKAFEVEAYDYSSKTWRVRMLLACVSEPVRSKTREQYMHSVLRMIKLPPHSIKEFLIDGGLDRDPKTKRFKDEMEYQEIHAIAYLANKLPWPPTNSQMMVSHGLDKAVPTTSQRPLEVAFFISSVFPYDAAKADSDGYQYCDINLSLERLTGANFDVDPWRPHLRTLTTKTTWFIRWHDVDSIPNRIMHHVLDGAECMQLIGYDQSYTAVNHKDEASSDLTLAAGNAYNGFGYCAFTIAFFAALNQVSEAEVVIDDLDSAAASSDNCDQPTSDSD
jgi:site-specific DNA-cytosine methylase